MADAQATEQTAPQDAAALYAQLTPEQLSAFAQQFISRFLQSDNSTSHQLAANVDPYNATPQQVADMHEHASQAHPGFLENLVNHTFATSALRDLAISGVEQYFKSKMKG